MSNEGVEMNNERVKMNGGEVRAHSWCQKE
jgi:hypothetical protein